MNKKQLLPCGCGGESKVIFPFTHTDVYLVECNECGICTSSYNTEVEAIEAWNRAMGERIAKVLNITHVRGYPPDGECGNCGFDVTDDGEYCPGCGAKLDWSDV